MRAGGRGWAKMALARRGEVAKARAGRLLSSLYLPARPSPTKSALLGWYTGKLDLKPLDPCSWVVWYTPGIRRGWVLLLLLPELLHG